MATLRELIGGVNTDDGTANLRAEQSIANGMGDLRRGWATGRLGTEINPLRTDELDAQIAGDTAKSGALRAQIAALEQRQGMYTPRVGQVEKIGGVGDALDWAQGQVGQGAASMLDPMAVSAGLGTVGRIAGALPGPGKLIGKAAQLAALGVPALMSKQQLTGEFIGSAGQDEELMARTSPQALRDMAGNYGTLAAIPDSVVPGMIGRQLSGLSRAGGTVARQSTMGIGTKTALGMGMEGATEAGQNMGSQYALGQLNPDRDTSGDFMENVNSFAGGAIGAGPMTAAGAFAEAGHNRVGAGVDRVTEAAGGVVDMLNENETVKNVKAKAGELGGKAKGGIVDMFGDEDGEVTVGGVVGKASEQIAKYKRSADELDLLSNDTPPAGMDEAKTAAWFDQNDAKRDTYVQSTLAGMADDPEAQAMLEKGDMTAGAEFLIARHDLTQIKAKLASRTQRLAVGAGSVAGTLAKGAFGIAKDVVSGVASGLSKKNFQTDESGQMGGNADDPYLQWQERTGFPSAKGESASAKGATDGMRTAAEDQSYRRALLFGNKMADAARVAGEPESAKAMQDVGFQLADMSRGWANMDKAAQTGDGGGMRLALGEIGNDLRALFGPKAAAVIGEMERISDPTQAGLFQALKEEMVRSGTPEGRALREQLRSTAADRLLMMLPKAHYDEATSTPNGKMRLLEQIEQLASGGYPKETREGVEKVYGRSRLNAMFNIVGGMTTDLTSGGEEQVTEVDALAEKDGLKAMDKSRESDIFGFGGGLDLRSKKDASGKSVDLFGVTKKPTTEEKASGIEGRRPQLFRTTTDADGNVTGNETWDKPGQSSENKLQAQIDLMKAKVGHVDEDNTNGWGVEARSAHEMLDEQRTSPMRRLAMYRDYLRQDADDRDYAPTLGMKGRKDLVAKVQEVSELVADMRQREGKPPKPQSEWTNEDTASWKKQLSRATANGFAGEDTSQSAIDEFELNRLMPEVKEYFSRHHVVVARNQQDKNEQKLDAGKAMTMKAAGKKLADRVKLDAYRANIDGGTPASDQVASDANMLMFPVQKMDKFGKVVIGEDGKPATEDMPIRASDLVLWAKTSNASNGSSQDAKEESGSPAKRNREYLEHLLAGVNAFTNDGHALGMPYKMNGGGQKESFNDGIPDSLRLDNAVYAEAKGQKGFRLTNNSPLQNKGSLARVGPNKTGPEDIRTKASNQRAVRKDQGRSEEFFTAEQREEREPTLGRDASNAGTRTHVLSLPERRAYRKLPQDGSTASTAAREAYIGALKEQYGPEWAEKFDLFGPTGAQVATREKVNTQHQDAALNRWDDSIAQDAGEKPLNRAPERRRADRSGQVASEAKTDSLDGTQMDYTRGQDPKAEWDENSELEYRTSVLTADFKQPTSALKAMSSARYNAEALQAMTLNDHREGDRMAITMLRTALKSSVHAENKGKTFDPYRIAPLVHLVSENHDEPTKGEYAAKTNAEYFEQAGATPELINILRRGSMQVLIREMESKDPSMTEAHILKLARQLPGIAGDTDGFNVVARLQAQLNKEGTVSEQDLAANWGDPALRKSQPKMSPPPVVAAPPKEKVTMREKSEARKAEPVGTQSWELSDDEIDNMDLKPAPAAKAPGGEVNRVVDAEAVRRERNKIRENTDLSDDAGSSLPVQPENLRVGLGGTGENGRKDQVKSDRANKFIGKGVEGSSTAKYAAAWGNRANVGSYTASDKVFVSTNGDRPGRIMAQAGEIKLATSAGATIITDNTFHRSKAYNVGEKRVAYVLKDAGYTESAPGVWTPAAQNKPAPGVANGQPGKPSGGVKRNAMAVTIHNDLGRSGFGATHDSPIRHEGKFDWRAHQGKGEGNASFGAGTYLSTADGVHKSYKTQFTASAATQQEMDAAKAWLDKVLPGTVLKFVDEAGWSGEYVEAQNLINISKTAAAGIMGTVYHEGLHKFFGQLIKGNPKLLGVMNDFVNDPKVMARINELLADCPAAQAQLVDGEERLAYAFQFWKAGLLHVDATPANLLQKIGALFRRVFGAVRNSEHVNAIFSDFDSGKLADPSVAGKVIADQLSKGTNNLAARRKLDKFVQGLAAGVLPAEMILGNSVSPSARKIGKLLFTNPGGGEDGGSVGYLNAKRNTSASFDNRAKQMFEHMNKVDMDGVQEAMQRGTPLADIKIKDQRDAVDGMRKLMDEFHGYMTKSGLKVGKVKDYYPTVWSVDQLHAKKAEFLKMLVNNYAQQMNPEGGNAHKSALRIWQSLIDRNGVDDIRLEAQRLDAQENKGPAREDGVLSPFFSGQESRALPWLEGQHKADFLEKNMVGTLSTYFHQGVRATEYRRRFGENGIKLEVMLKNTRAELAGASKEMMARGEFKTDEARGKWVARQMRDVSMSVGAIEGTLGKDISPNMRKFNSWMVVYQNVRLLPMALFASFVDPLAMVARGAPMAAAFESFVHGVKSVLRGWSDSFKDLPPERVKSEWAKLAEHIGATEVAAFTHHVAEEYSSAYMSPAAKKINDAMFRFNGMEAWDRSNRIMATKWAVRFIEKHAALPDKNHSARWLQELGLTKATVPLNADGELITDKHELSAVKGISIEQAAKEMAVVHAALNRWVEGAVITPNAAQRPAWSSDPNYSIFFHLKQFSYSFQQTIMKRAVNEVQHGNIAPIGALAMFIPTMIASDILKGLIQGGGTLPPYMAGYTAGDWALHGLNRSGLAAVGDIGMDAAIDPISLAGPAAEQLADAARQPFEKTLVNAMPLHSMFEYMLPSVAK